MSDDEARAGHEDEKDEVEAQKHKLNLRNAEAKDETDEVEAHKHKLNLRNAEAKDETKGEGDDDFEGHRRIAKL
jgi:hypothetical protein